MQDDKPITSTQLAGGQHMDKQLTAGTLVDLAASDSGASSAMLIDRKGPHQKPTSVTKLTIAPLRDAFPREATDFTTWMETNIDALSERLGIILTVVEREKNVGDFSADLVCTDKAGRRVIIENQLEKTDHSHLGQLLTYLVNYDASIAIWVASEARVEHQNVINWLNETAPGGISFYLIQVEIARIGDSPYAPLFTVLARPSDEAKEIAQEKELASRHYKRQAFWKELLERSKTKTSLFAKIKPSTVDWIATGAGVKGGVIFLYRILMESGSVELYIDTTKAEVNKAIFDALRERSDEIEREFGNVLDWERQEDVRYSRIVKRFNDAGLATPETWPQLQDAMIDSMIRLHKALRPHLESIQI
jgi:hypothetical protein